MNPYTLEDWRLIAGGHMPINKRVKSHAGGWHT